MHSNFYKALKIQMIARVDSIHKHALKAKYAAYGKLSCLKVITHLNSNCYEITPAYLKENTACMKSAYDVNQPFETVIDHIEMAVDFANNRRVPFTPK